MADRKGDADQIVNTARHAVLDSPIKPRIKCQDWFTIVHKL